MPQPSDLPSDLPSDWAVGRRWLRQADKRERLPFSRQDRQDDQAAEPRDPGRPVRDRRRGRRPFGGGRRRAARRLGRAGREAQDGGRLPQLRLRAVEGAARGGATGASHALGRGVRHPAGDPSIDAAAVCDHVQGVIAAIAPNDSVERFAGLGVKVIRANGHFITRDTLLAGDQRIRRGAS